MRYFSRISMVAAGAVILLGGPSAFAQSGIDFGGKTVNMYLGGSVGGGVDTFTRTFLNHYRNHLPGNPTIVVRNMRGAGGIQAVAFTYANGAKDGTAMTTMPAGPIQAAAFGDRQLDYDIRNFEWIGSLGVGRSMCFTWHTSSFKSFEDMKAREMVISATGAQSNSTLLPIMVNRTAGTLMRPIAGYGGANSVMAVEQGEVDGRCLTWDSLKTNQSQWIADNLVTFLLDVSLEPNRELPAGVPWIMDVIDNDLDRLAMRLFLTPSDITVPLGLAPGTPEAAVAVHRTAFEATVRDPAYLADAQRRNQDIEPRAGEDVAALINSLFTSDPMAIQRVKDHLAAPRNVGECEGAGCR